MRPVSYLQEICVANSANDNDATTSSDSNNDNNNNNIQQ